MRTAQEKDRANILKYLKNGLKDCVYIYIDILNYGISSENMTVWVDESRESEGYSLVVMKYYDSFQIYSHELSHDMMPVSELLDQYPVAMISGRKDLIEELAELRKDYKATYGSVFTVDFSSRRLEKTSASQVLNAAESDADEIAALICMDEAFHENYTVDVLAAQLRERIRTGTGRSCIIRENGRIVAHMATYAEAENIAVLSGVIVHPVDGKLNNYFWANSYLMGQLKAEGKTVYLFVMKDRYIRTNEKRNTKCGEYGKLVRIN